MKLVNRSLMMVLMVVLLAGMSGCGKYEDGPSFSLASKKARLVGDYKVMKYNGTDMSDYYMTFNSDQTYSIKMVILGVALEYDGTWAFQDGKEVVAVTVQNSTDLFTITRLTDDEFWFKDKDGKVWELDKQ
jgi:hypothetical protein